MKDYIKIIEEDFQEEIQFLQGLVRINSEQKEAVSTEDGAFYPFGQGVEDAYQYTLRGGEQMGFTAADASHYGGHLEYGTAKPILGILAHLDVVPAGDGWTHAPYDGDLEDGWMYGRGTTDDKGPLVAALFAMRALKKAGYEPSARIRLIIGLDEETGSIGMGKYIEELGSADYGFTPDADFPVVYAEKGILTFDLVKKIKTQGSKGLRLNKIEGGAASNMVPDFARALVRADREETYTRIREHAAEFVQDWKTREAEGFVPSIQIRNTGKSLAILVEGKAAHGASPELGVNAISVLMDFLSGLNFASEEVNDWIAFYTDHIGYDLQGERIGCQMRDDLSGALSFNVGLAGTDKQTFTWTVNVRYPVSRTAEDVCKGIEEVIKDYEIGLVVGDGLPPICQSPDSPLVKTLVDSYREFTGDDQSQPLAIGGGTYARTMPHHIAFGAAFPGDEDRMHQRDERLSPDRLLTTTKIYAKALYALSQPDFKVE